MAQWPPPLCTLVTVAMESIGFGTDAFCFWSQQIFCYHNSRFFRYRHGHVSGSPGDGVHFESLFHLNGIVAVH